MSAVKNVIKDNYNMMLLKDYLREAIKDAGFSHAEISKTPVGTRVALHVTRPGIVIGRKGTGIRALTEKLATDFALKNPQISVVEIEKPELAPSVMCNRMASHLERGTAFRRATMWTLKQIMKVVQWEFKLQFQANLEVTVQHLKNTHKEFYPEQGIMQK